MLSIGKFNHLEISRDSPNGLYLLYDDGEEVLLPNKYVTQEIVDAGSVDVFVYTDSEDRLVAITDKPFAQVDEYAYLEAVAVTHLGAFMDWGLEKNLFVPFKEQARPIEVGEFYIVRVCLDHKTSRPFGSTKWRSLFELASFSELKRYESIEVLIAERTPLGYLCIVNNLYEGLLLAQDAPHDVRIGQKITGFPKRVREDGKVDILLRKDGISGIEEESEKIFAYLQAKQGFMTYNDNSSPDEILKVFGMSKKTFKKGLGVLLKAKKITIVEKGVQIV